MATSPGHAASHEAVAASLRVVESAIELGRAEAKLAGVRARVLATHALTLLLGSIVAMTFVALSLVILAVAPLVLAPHASLGRPPWPLALSLCVSLAIVGAGAKAAHRAMNALKADAATDANRPGGTPS